MFSIVVQGRLNHISLSRLQKYTSIGPVYYCYRSDDDVSILEKYNNEGIKFLPYPAEVPDTTFNCFNTYYHCLSTLTGLRKVKTPYVIKVRSDNYIGNLKPLMDAVIQHPQKYICSNLYFRPDMVAKFCPSDQVIGCSTPLLLKAFEIACKRCELDSKTLREAYNDHRQTSNDYYVLREAHQMETVSNASAPMERGKGISPEVLIGTSFLVAKKVTPDPDLSRQQMLENFDIVCLEDMRPYMGKDGSSLIPHAGSEIHNIKDI